VLFLAFAAFFVCFAPLSEVSVCDWRDGQSTIAQAIPRSQVRLFIAISFF